MKMKRANTDAAKARREQDILDAALDLFAEQGFHATKMDDIAAKVGLSKGTLYLYFANKEDIFRMLIMRMANVHTQQMIDFLDQYEDLEQALTQITEMMIDRFYHSRLPKIFRVLLSEAALFPEMVAFYRANVIEPWQRAFVARLGNDAQAYVLAQLFIAPFIFSALRSEIVFADQPIAEADLRCLLHTQLAMIVDYFAEKRS